MNTPQPGDRIAYFGRVSTPKQKLEHQWETVERWCQTNGLDIPNEQRYEEKIRRHVASSLLRDWDKRKLKPNRKHYRFDDLIAKVVAGKLDWIVIASFDRWGISDRDEIFIFRSKLREYDVQLYSVVDNLNITGTDEAAFFGVAVKAVAATGYVSQQAEKNIQKMVLMAQQGWATTGNSPFGIDLVLYNLSDLTRPLYRVERLRFKPHQYKITHYAKSSHVERNELGIITKHHLKIEREEITEAMPPRDKKATGYKYEPNPQRTEAVRKMFELYDSGMNFASISESLWQEGHKHYDKPFGYHGVEVILSNSAYIGKPAWGKVGVGEYKFCIDKQPTAAKRKKDDTLVLKKTEDQYIYPTNPQFEPIVPIDLYERVKAKLAERPVVNESFGKRRTRDKASHPLNGKLHCPDCEAPMVLGSHRSKGKEYRCFHCGTWRKTIRKKCNANTVNWELLNKATTDLLNTVSDRIECVRTGNLSGQDWLKQSELGNLLVWINWAVDGQIDVHGRKIDKPKQEHEVDDQFRELEELGNNSENMNPAELRAKMATIILSEEEEFLSSPDKIEAQYEELFAAYDAKFGNDTSELRAELERINEELDAIGDELPLQRRKNPGLAERLDKKALELGRRKAEIEPKLVPLTGKARTLIEQLTAIQQTIERANELELSRLLDSFVERVYPIFDVKQVGNNKRRTEVIGFRFLPRKSAEKVLPQEMELRFSRTDDSVFHFIASLFTGEITHKTTTQESRIRALRQEGKSLAEIASETGTTVAIVRRIVGKLDPSVQTYKKQQLQEIAKRIEAEGGTWAEKVIKWQSATKTSGTTFWRVLKRQRQM